MVLILEGEEAPLNPDPFFKREKLLGSGNYGAVYKARHKRTGHVAAMKEMEITEEDLPDIELEIQIMDECQCPQIVSYFGTFMKDNKLIVIMELCTGGAVTDVMKILGSGLREEYVSLVCRESLKGLQYMHEHRMIHRDIKGGNILVNDRGEVKLADFGVSTITEQGGDGKRCSFVGSPYWMPPEVVLCDTDETARYNNKCDIWALAITAIEIADGDPPFSDLHPLRAMFLIQQGKTPITLQNPKKWSKNFIKFIDSLLIRSPNKRPSAKDALSNSFCDYYDKERSKKKVDSFETFMQNTLPSVDPFKPFEMSCYEADRKAMEPSSPNEGSHSLLKPLEVTALAAGKSPTMRLRSGSFDSIMEKKKFVAESEEDAIPVDLRPEPVDDENDFAFTEGDVIANPLFDNVGSDDDDILPVETIDVTAANFDGEVGVAVDFNELDWTQTTSRDPSSKSQKSRFQRSTSSILRPNMPTTRGSKVSRNQTEAPDTITNLNVMGSKGGSKQRLDTINSYTSFQQEPSSLLASLGADLLGETTSHSSRDDDRQLNTSSNSASLSKEIILENLTQKSFPSAVLCGDVLRRNTYLLGTAQGLFVLDQNGKFTKIISGTAFFELSVLPSLGVVVAQVGRRQRHIRMYKYDTILALADAQKVKPIYEKVKESKGCFTMSMVKLEETLLVVGFKKKINLYLWADTPHKRFMLIQTLVIPGKPSITQPVYGSGGEFSKVASLIGGKVNLTPLDEEQTNKIIDPDPSKVEEPMTMMPCGNQDILVGYWNKGFLMDSETLEVIDEPIFKWRSYPLLCSPFRHNKVLTFVAAGLDVFDRFSGELLHNVPLQIKSARFLCTQVQAILVSITEEDGSHNVYICRQ